MEKMNKRVSIVIPHKNDMERLERLIQSIPKRNYIEIIVVDDHSNNFEDLQEKILSIEHVKLFQNLSNVNSAGKARNIGIAESTGDFILFADSDDYFLQNFEEEINKYISQDFDIIYFRPELEEVINGKPDPILKMYDSYFNRKSYLNYMKLKLNNNAPWSKLISRKYIVSNDFKFDEVKKNNDAYFSELIAINTDKITFSDIPIYNYTVHEGGLVSTNTEDAFLSNVWVQSRVFELLNTSYDEDILVKVVPQIQYMAFKQTVEAIFRYKNIKIMMQVINTWKTNSKWHISFHYIFLGFKSYIYKFIV